MAVKKPTRKMSKRQEKICNICGESVLVYSVMQNAPLCEECVPIKKINKIESLGGMMDKILDKKV